MTSIVRRGGVAARVIDEPGDEADEKDREPHDDERKTEEDAEREDRDAEAEERRRETRTRKMDLVLGRRAAVDLVLGHSVGVY